MSAVAWIVQVFRGERYWCRKIESNYRQARSSVTRRRARRAYKRLLRCVGCEARVQRRVASYCPECKWVLCPACEICGCGVSVQCELAR